MTAPPPPDQPAGASPDDDLVVVEEALTDSQPGRVTRALRGVQVAIKILCGLGILSGLAALSLGLNAWWGTPPALVWVVAVSATTVGLGTYIIVRTSALAAALTNPSEVLEQAIDLVERAKGTAELANLANLVRRRKAAGREPRVGRVRRTIRRGRTISAVIGIANPDPKRHSHLVAFTPTRLARLWSALAVALWAWGLSLVTAFVAFWVLVAKALT